MSQSVFRWIVTAVLLLGAVVVIHDVWAKHRSRSAVKLWTEAEYKTQGQYGRSRTLEEIRKENEQVHTPKTWLF